MRAIIKALRPTPLGIIFLLLLVSLQALFFSSYSTTHSLGSENSIRSESAYGIGTPISASEEGGKTGYRVQWTELVLNLAITYVLALLVARGIVKVTQLRRPAATYSFVAIVMIGVAFLVSTGGSKIYWGYFFARPALLREVNEIAQVNAVIPIKTESDVAGKHPIVVNDDFSLTEAIANGKRDPYYCLDERILIELERRKLLPAAHAATFVGLPELCSLVNGSGVLAKSEKGYHSTNFLRGIVVEALDRSGSRLVFLCLEGGQVSNDHYPYYETVFKRRDGSPELSFVRGQRFFYDVAGMEGAEWYSIWPFLSVFGVIAGFVLFTIARGIWSKAKRETAPRSNSESSTSPP